MTLLSKEIPAALNSPSADCLGGKGGEKKKNILVSAGGGGNHPVLLTSHKSQFIHPFLFVQVKRKEYPLWKQTSRASLLNIAAVSAAALFKEI